MWVGSDVMIDALSCFFYHSIFTEAVSPEEEKRENGNSEIYQTWKAEVSLNWFDELMSAAKLPWLVG